MAPAGAKSLKVPVFPGCQMLSFLSMKSVTFSVTATGIPLSRKEILLIPSVMSPYSHRSSVLNGLRVERDSNPRLLICNQAPKHSAIHPVCRQAIRRSIYFFTSKSSFLQLCFNRSRPVFTVTYNDGIVPVLLFLKYQL